MKHVSKKANLKGFTLIEILIVIGLIAILAAVTVIALNPQRNFADARNSERRSEIAQVMNAFNQWLLDGNNYSTITQNAGTPVPSCTAATGGGADAAEISDLNVATTIAPEYIAEFPTDPSDDSDYMFCFAPNSGTDRIVIYAPEAESGETISISR